MKRNDRESEAELSEHQTKAGGDGAEEGKEEEGEHGAAAESAMKAPPALKGGEEQKHGKGGQYIPEDVVHVVCGFLRAHLGGAFVVDPEEGDEADEGQGGQEGAEFVAALHHLTDEGDDAGAEEVFEEKFQSHRKKLIKTSNEHRGVGFSRTTRSRTGVIAANLILS